MSEARPSRGGAARRAANAPLLFAALGDERRLELVSRLSARSPQSISQLTAGSRVTRQAITKHLRILEGAGLVHRLERGRESLFTFEAAPLQALKIYLDAVSRQWDETLSRLKAFVEDDPTLQPRGPAPMKR